LRILLLLSLRILRRLVLLVFFLGILLLYVAQSPLY